jgi:hypothetical protein
VGGGGVSVGERIIVLVGSTTSGEGVPSVMGIVEWIAVAVAALATWSVGASGVGSPTTSTKATLKSTRLSANIQPARNRFQLKVPS